MSEEEIRAMNITPNRIIKITLGTLIVSFLVLFTGLFTGYFWLDDRFDRLDRRIFSLEIRAMKGDVTMSTGNQTVRVEPEFPQESAKEIQIKEILALDPAFLSVQDLAVIEGVVDRTIIRRIVRQPDGAYCWVDNDDRQWTARKVGKSWRVFNPYRIARNDSE